VPGEVAAQFAAAALARLGGIEGNVLFPAAERLGLRIQTGIEFEVVDQAIRRQPVHIAAIPFRGFEEGRGQQAHLSHREGLHAQGGVLAGEVDLLERRDVVHRALPPGRIQTGIGIGRSRGLLLRTGGAGGGDDSRKGTAVQLLFHDDTSAAWNRLHYATRRIEARSEPGASGRQGDRQGR
jgi:hypothetical protein